MPTHPITAATARKDEEPKPEHASRVHPDLDALAAADRARLRHIPVSPTPIGVSLSSSLDRLDRIIIDLTTIVDPSELLPFATSNIVALVAHLLVAREVLASVVFAESPSSFPTERP